MCVEAEGCSEDTYSSVRGGNFRGVCPCRGVLTVKETGLSGVKPDRLRYLGGRNAGTTNGRQKIGLYRALAPHTAHGMRIRNVPQGGVAPSGKFRFSFMPSEETPG